MARKRYTQQRTDWFFGKYLYAQPVPDRHFLRQHVGLVAWEVFAEKLVRLCQRQVEVGCPQCNLAVIQEMLLLSYLHVPSERKTEAYVSDNLATKRFLVLAIDEAAPDHSTLTALKGRIVEREGKGD